MVASPIINGIPAPRSVPRILSHKYKYAAFSDPFEVMIHSDGGEDVSKTIDVRGMIERAWNIVAGRADKSLCNNYFKRLSRGKSLQDVLQEGSITIHCLVPKSGHQFSELPAANTAGRDIGVNPNLLLSNNATDLACTLIHELAHVAGASTNADKSDPHSGDAEGALPSCGCKADPGNLGLMTYGTGFRIA